MTDDAKPKKARQKTDGAGPFRKPPRGRRFEGAVPVIPEPNEHGEYFIPTLGTVEWVGIDKPLNDRQEAFAQHYAATLNATDAFRKAGYASQHPDSDAYRLKQLPRVRRRINELRSQIHEQVKMEAVEVLARAAMIARSDIRGVIGPNGEIADLRNLDEEVSAAIAGVDVLEEKVDGAVVGYTKKVRLRDPMPALRLLAEHLKLVKNDSEGVNALAGAIADRLKAARERRKQKESAS